MDREPSITDLLYDIPVGDSRVFVEQKGDTLRRIATRLQKRYDRAYTCRSTPEGYQVWRTA